MDFGAERGSFRAMSGTASFGTKVSASCTACRTKAKCGQFFVDVERRAFLRGTLSLGQSGRALDLDRYDSPWSLLTHDWGIHRYIRYYHLMTPALHEIRPSIDTRIPPPTCNIVRHDTSHVHRSYCVAQWLSGRVRRDRSRSRAGVFPAGGAYRTGGPHRRRGAAHIGHLR
jgi:hypothetical protein